MEILRGCDNKEGLRNWKIFLKNFNISILPLSPEISTKAMYWFDEFSLSHGIEISDALIAATANTNNLALVTSNIKDFKFSTFDGRIF